MNPLDQRSSFSDMSSVLPDPKILHSARGERSAQNRSHSDMHFVHGEVRPRASSEKTKITNDAALVVLASSLEEHIPRQDQKETKLSTRIAGTFNDEPTKKEQNLQKKKGSRAPNSRMLVEVSHSSHIIENATFAVQLKKNMKVISDVMEKLKKDVQTKDEKKLSYIQLRKAQYQYLVGLSDIANSMIEQEDDPTLRVDRKDSLSHLLRYYKYEQHKGIITEKTTLDNAFWEQLKCINERRNNVFPLLLQKHVFSFNSNYISNDISNLRTSILRTTDKIGAFRPVFKKIVLRSISKNNRIESQVNYSQNAYNWVTELFQALFFIHRVAKSPEEISELVNIFLSKKKGSEAEKIHKPKGKEKLVGDTALNLFKKKFPYYSILKSLGNGVWSMGRHTFTAIWPKLDFDKEYKPLKKGYSYKLVLKQSADYRGQQGAEVLLIDKHERRNLESSTSVIGARQVVRTVQHIIYAVSIQIEAITPSKRKSRKSISELEGSERGNNLEIIYLKFQCAIEGIGSPQKKCVLRIDDVIKRSAFPKNCREFKRKFGKIQNNIVKDLEAYARGSHEIKSTDATLMIQLETGLKWPTGKSKSYQSNV